MAVRGTTNGLRRLMLRTFQSPGDVVMLTAAVRDLHLAHPGRFQTDVRTSADALWENNPYVTRLADHEPGVESLDMHYPLVHQSNQRPYHFIHGYPQYLEQQLGVPIPVTRLGGDIHLSPEERERGWLQELLGEEGPFWIVMAGGKYDFTAKWWDPKSFQAVVDHFQDSIRFVQCGEEGHWHPRLDGVIDLVGKTSLREMVRLVYHTDGVLSGVTLAMHLAAAVPPRPGGPVPRACVVVAGGREPPHWEAYSGHQFISTVGALACCADGGCWRSRCQLVGDGDSKDRDHVCERPVELSPNLRIPQCMAMIQPEDVIRRIELYHHEGGTARYRHNGGCHANGAAGSPQSAHAPENAAENTGGSVTSAAETPKKTSMLVDFRHGLGDAVQLTSVLAHVRHYHPDWDVDVAALVGKHSAFEGLCRKVFVKNREQLDRSAYDGVYDLEWHECGETYAAWPSTKAQRCLLEVFRLTPMPELCRYEIRISEEARRSAEQYLAGICGDRPEVVGPGGCRRYPAVLIHYQGNTSADRKNLSHELAGQLCRDILAAGGVPVVLDWDKRTPLADQVRIHNPGADHPLWGGTGTGDAQVLAALVEASALVIAVDSGPLHVAAATSTPTLAVWTGHHPLHYLPPAENVTHLVPADHRSMLRGNAQVGSEYFEAHYRYETYTNLEQALRKLVFRIVPAGNEELIQVDGFWIRRDNALADLVIVQDIAEEDSYRVGELAAVLGATQEPVVVDVGAHIGVFSRKVFDRYPRARIVAVECCPENLQALERNVGSFASLVPAAMTYEADVALLNAVYPDCVSTGGSAVIQRNELEDRLKVASPQSAAGEADAAGAAGPVRLGEYWADLRPLATVNLEEIMARHVLATIDILKLDCEGSEFSILENTTSLASVRAIVGEYHGRHRFERLVEDRFGGWDFRVLREGDPGTFWLINRQARSPASSAERSAHVPGGLPAKEDPAGRFWQTLLERIHPIDLPAPDAWKRYYARLYELARQLAPRSICEIGVRAGYSAFAMLAANPEASLLGIEADLDEAAANTHGGRKGLYRHALKILEPYDFRLLVADSHTIESAPGRPVDLVYIDGDHTFEGCLADLELAERSTGTILVDDYDSIPQVRQACEKFCEEHPWFSRRYIDNGLTGLLLLQRELVSPQGAELAIDGRRLALSADYELRFVQSAGADLQQPDGPARPVLYERGRRVIKRWSLRLEHHEPADPWGISGGKDEPEKAAKAKG